VLIRNVAKSILCNILVTGLNVLQNYFDNPNKIIFESVFNLSKFVDTSAKRFFACTITVFINYNIHEYIFTWNANYFNFNFYFFNYCRLSPKIVYPSQYATIKYRFARIYIIAKMSFTRISRQLTELFYTCDSRW